MGLPTLHWLYSIELSSNKQSVENIKDKYLSVRFRVLSEVNPNLCLFFFIREIGQYGNIRKETIVVRKTSPLT